MIQEDKNPEFEYYHWLRPASLWRTSKIITVFRYRRWWEQGSLSSYWRVLATGRPLSSAENELVEQQRLAGQAREQYSNKYPYSSVTTTATTA